MQSTRQDSKKPMMAIKARKGKSGRRALHEVEKYSKLYYKERVQATVAEDLTPFGPKPPAGVVLDTIRRVTREIYRDEDDETKAVVKAALATDLASASAEKDGEDDETDDPLTPEQMQE